MGLIDQITQYARGIPAEIKEKKGLYTIQMTVAERKAFLSKQKLTYQAKLRVDDGSKAVQFSEMLSESSTGMDSPGMTFQTENYRTGKGGRQESGIEQQADLFGKKYDYAFDFKAIRGEIERLSQAAGYEFKYQITPLK